MFYFYEWKLVQRGLFTCATKKKRSGENMKFCGLCINQTWTATDDYLDINISWWSNVIAE